MGDVEEKDKEMTGVGLALVQQQLRVWETTYAASFATTMGKYNVQELNESAGHADSTAWTVEFDQADRIARFIADAAMARVAGPFFEREPERKPFELERTENPYRSGKMGADTLLTKAITRGWDEGYIAGQMDVQCPKATSLTRGRHCKHWLDGDGPECCVCKAPTVLNRTLG